MNFRVEITTDEIKILESNKVQISFNKTERAFYQIDQSIAADGVEQVFLLELSRVEKIFYGYFTTEVMGKMFCLGLLDSDGNHHSLIKCLEEDADKIASVLQEELPELKYEKIGRYKPYLNLDNVSLERVLIGIPLGIVAIILIGFLIAYLNTILPKSITSVIQVAADNMWLIAGVLLAFFSGIKKLRSNRSRPSDKDDSNQ